MSNAEHTPTNRPADDAALDPLHRALSVQFHPPIKLERSKGLQFASKLSSAIDATGVELSESRWVLSEPLGSHAAGQFTVSVGDSNLQIESMFPSDKEERFETKAGFILTEFEKFFRPELLLGSGAIVRGTLQIDGDARSFLSDHVTSFDMGRLKSLGRPVHTFGIRLMMPPYNLAPATTKKKPVKRATKPIKTTKPKKAASSADWMVDIKAESWIEDTSKLFLEAQAQWQSPHQWNSGAREDVVGRLATVSTFIQKNFIPFLTNDSTGD